MRANRILKILIAITSSILCVLLFVLAFQIVFNGNLKNKFQENVVISGVNVKGLTKSEAETKVNNTIKDKIDNFKITLKYKDRVWEFSSKDFVVESSVHNIIDDAFRYSQISSSEKEKISKIQKLGVNYDVAFNKVFLNFKDRIEEIKKEIEIEPINSEVEFLPNSKEIFKIIKSQNGLKLNEEKLYAEIEKQFQGNNNICVNLEMAQVVPDIIEDDFKGKLELLGEFSTDLSTSKGGRKHNVDLALSKFNGKVVKQNEEVSFNEITGPQTAETGYQNAIIIQNGQYIEGVGGGICQASTTLYNALLLSGVEIKEVHKHTLPVGYVEMGLDAMVNEGTSDLRFKNTTESSIYIKSYVEGERAYVKIYGKPLQEGVSFKRNVEYVRSIAHNGDKIIKDTQGEYSDKVLYEGEYYRLSYPKEGHEVKGYLEKYINGELVGKELIRHEIYEPKQGVLIEGVKEKSVEQNKNVASEQTVSLQTDAETFCVLNLKKEMEE